MRVPTSDTQQFVDEMVKSVVEAGGSDRHTERGEAEAEETRRPVRMASTVARVVASSDDDDHDDDDDDDDDDRNHKHRRGGGGGGAPRRDEQQPVRAAAAPCGGGSPCVVSAPTLLNAALWATAQPKRLVVWGDTAGAERPPRRRAPPLGRHTPRRCASRARTAPWPTGE